MIHLFDLDITLWDCYDKNGNPIWAKQMIAPFKKNDNIITDDVNSTCVLRYGVKDYLKFLTLQKDEIGFVSAGRYFNLPDNFQPTNMLLKEFEVFYTFNYIRILEYKTYNKANLVKYINNPIVFYDDNLDVLNSIVEIKNVITVNSKEIKDWTKLIGNKYDRYIICSPERL